jgi:NAD dependent epimerase/dehydratase family enzyme
LLGREAVGEVLLASQRVIPEVLQSQGYRFTHPDLESALRAALGMPALVA